MSKREVKLRFPDLYTLWNFAQSIQVGTMEIRAGEKLLICPCSDADISIALKKYRAEILMDETELAGVNRFENQN